MIPRVLMQDHLRYTCPRRRANCEHCHKEFSGSALEVREILLIFFFGLFMLVEYLNKNEFMTACVNEENFKVNRPYFFYLSLSLGSTEEFKALKPNKNENMKKLYFIVL